MPHLDDALCLDPGPPASAAECLAQRIRMVLETLPGTLPYAPEFGCDLDGLVGSSSNKARLSEAKGRVAGALRRWIPDIEITQLDVTTTELRKTARQRGAIPIAEAALASRVVSTALQIRIQVETPDGAVYFDATLASEDS